VSSNARGRRAANVGQALRAPLVGFLTALAFLTRIPVARGPILDEELGRSLAFFPLAGAVLGLALAAMTHVFGSVLPPLLLAALAAALLALATGGLHLDGVADLSDAAGGGRGDRARMLEIMRDSRIGAHGAAALVLILVAKVAALADVAARGDLALVLLFPAVARWAVTPLVVFFPYVRPEGLGRGFNGAGRAGHVAAGTAVLAVLVGVLAPRVALAAAGALGSTVALGWWAQRRLGGLTGDVYGAAIELAEVTTLAVGCAIATIKP
jgi:adenosylcobinamide-GDP ribazoletransferase